MKQKHANVNVLNVWYHKGNWFKSKSWLYLFLLLILQYCTCVQSMNCDTKSMHIHVLLHQHKHRGPALHKIPLFQHFSCGAPRTTNIITDHSPFQLVPCTPSLQDWHSVSCDSKASKPWRIKCLCPQCVCPRCWPATGWLAKRLKTPQWRPTHKALFVSDVVCPIKANKGIPWLATVFTAGLSQM